MRILVFGAGAIGSFLGGLLSKHHDVTLIGRDEHIAAIRARGLRISGKTAIIARPHVATHVPQNARPDAILITTKAYDTAKAMDALVRFGERATFVTLQNGLDNAETIAARARRVVAGTTSHGVMIMGPGEIRHSGVGETVFGAWSGVERSDLVRLRDVFAEAGLRADLTDDVRSELWSKLVVNVSINPLAAIAGVPNGSLVRDKRLLVVLESVAKEATAVAGAEGATVNGDDLRERAIRVARRTAANRSSMLQDLERGRRTEVDAITGALIRAADRHGIAVPLTRALDAIVRARESVVRKG